MSFLRSFAKGFASIGEGMANIVGSVFSQPNWRYDERFDRESILKSIGQSSTGTFSSSTTITSTGGKPVGKTKEAVADHLEETAKAWDDNARRWRATPFKTTGEEAAKMSEDVAQQYRDLAADVRAGKASFTVTEDA